jgi:hypothetical protein
MRKSLYLRVKAVVKSGVCGGFGSRLMRPVEFTSAEVVDNYGGFSEFTARFLRVVIHGQNLGSQSVNDPVLPIFHTTYYKLQLYKLNSC